MSNISFCHKVFKNCLLQMYQNASVCGKGLKLILRPEAQIRWGIQLFSIQYLSYYTTKPYNVGTCTQKILLSTHCVPIEYPLSTP